MPNRPSRFHDHLNRSLPPSYGGRDSSQKATSHVSPKSCGATADYSDYEASSNRADNNRPGSRDSPPSRAGIRILADTSTGRRWVTRWPAVRLLIAVSAIALAASCTPRHYRRQADRESYCAIEERLDDARWAVPSVSIKPHPQSRLADPFPPDCPPIPPDDPAAHRYMLCADGMEGYQGWNDNGAAPNTESPRWRDGLVLSEDGVLDLTPDRAIELGLMHSREYQNELEDLYLNALALTVERFEFDLQWFGGNDTTYRHAGTGSFPTESNTLTTASDLGFSRNFTRGGNWWSISPTASSGSLPDPTAAGLRLLSRSTSSNRSCVWQGATSGWRC